MFSARVLIVDDDNLTLRVIHQIIKKNFPTLAPLYAEDPFTALNLLKNEPFDLVISDYHMPEMDGFEFLGAVCEYFPETKRVLMSADSECPLMQNALETGFIHKLLPKPWTLDQVNEVFELCVKEEPTRFDFYLDYEEESAI